VENDVYEAIQELARKERVSVNFIANKALRRFVEWDVAASTQGFVSISSELLVKLMETLSPKQAQELGRWAGKTSYVPSMKYLSPTLSLPVAIKGLHMLSQYGGRFKFDHSERGRRHVIMIRHSMGRNWSAYYAGALEGIFGDSLGKKVRLKVGTDICLCEFEE
jgi:hypothetical protein